MSSNAGGEPKFPMRVSEFLAQADKFLNRGDIILSRSPTLSSKLIRYTSGGFFSHAALVFLVPQKSDGYESTFVVESLYAGVGIGNLATYIGGKKPSEEIAVLRLVGKGFDVSFFKQVRGLMLDHVQKPYDYGRAVNLALSFLFGIRLGWAKIRNTKLAYKKWTPSEFICSGFIQYGYVDAMLRKGLDPTPVIFKTDATVRDREALLATTPEDLATSDKLKWLYAARRGFVYRVNSYEEAQKTISNVKP
jgi:Permuted papain-like amidase enzyme, YaeF/YiiX, C92 family